MYKTPRRTNVVPTEVQHVVQTIAVAEVPVTLDTVLSQKQIHGMHQRRCEETQDTNVHELSSHALLRIPTAITHEVENATQEINDTKHRGHQRILYAGKEQ